MAARPSVWIGIDIGTSAVKVIAVADTGSTMASVSRPIATARDGDRVEQDPSDWLAAASACIRALPPDLEPRAIGIVGHVPTLVLVDDELAPVRPAIIWQDARATEEASELAATLGSSPPHVGIQLPWAPSQLPAMLAWVARNEPATRASTRWVLSPKDFLVAHLTGVVATDAWTSKGLVEVPSGAPAPAVLDAIGWDAVTIPPAHQPWLIVGSTQPGMFPAGIPVVAGWSDALAAMLAAGAFTDDRDFVLTGTSDIVGSSASTASGDVEGLLRIPRELAGREVLYGPTSSGGGVVAWAAALLGCSVEELVELAADSAPSGAGFAPYLVGERAPLWDDRLRGAFGGLSMADGRPEVARTVLHGVAGTAGAILAQCAAHGRGGRRDVHVVGRGALDGAWPDVRAEAWGRRQLVHRDSLGSATGAAMLAWAGAHDGDLEGAQRLAPAPIAVEPTAQQVHAAAARERAHNRATALALQWRAAAAADPDAVDAAAAPITEAEEA